MRVLRFVLVGAVVTVTACGGGAVKQSGLAGTTSHSLSPSSETTTAVAGTTTTGATTVGTSTTTISIAPTTVATTAPVTGTTTLPDCRTLTGPGTCQVTVPLRPDIDEIIPVYRKFAAEDLRIGQSPDNPDWDSYLALVNPPSRDNARTSLQAHFDRGEILNTSLGTSLNPRSTQAQLPEDEEIIQDCRRDGSYWADRVSGQPVVGESAEVKTVYMLATMRRVGGTWFVSAFQKLTSPCDLES